MGWPVFIFPVNKTEALVSYPPCSAVVLAWSMSSVWGLSLQPDCKFLEAKELRPLFFLHVSFSSPTSVLCYLSRKPISGEGLA